MLKYLVGLLVCVNLFAATNRVVVAPLTSISNIVMTVLDNNTNTFYANFYHILPGTVINLTSNVSISITNFSADPDNRNITIDSVESSTITNLLEGRFNIHYSLSCTGTDKDLLAVALYANGLAIGSSVSENTISGTNVINISGSGQMYLPANNTFNLRVVNRTSDDDITIRHVSLVLNKVF